MPEEKVDSQILFLGGPLDGAEFSMGEWPKEATIPGTEILHKPTGSMYRYHLPSSTPRRAAYTYRENDSAKARPEEPPANTQ